MTEKELSYDELGITLEDVYEQMGYRDATPDEATQAETAALIDEVRPWLRPRFCYVVFPLSSLLSPLSSFPPPLSSFPSPLISRQLKGSEAYAFFICTAGVAFEDYQQRLKAQGDMVPVFIADALGSVIAERCADQMERHLQQSIDKLGWHHTNRFSPGYCGWDVAGQQQLFPLFGGHTCGVTLNDSSLMVPIKSVSGIIGLGKQVRRLDYTCGLCDFANCYKRNKKQR